MNPNQEEDRQLLQRISAGEEPAFQMLFEKYYRYLCIASYKICGDEHKAKDMVQEVFLDLWKKRNTLNIHTSVQAFIKKAVIFKSIDYIRAQRLQFEDIPEEKETFGGAQEKLELAELKQLIHDTAARLPERCRVVFFMSRFEKMSHKEIAHHLNISPKTVENQITKALKILRNTIQPFLSDDLIKLLFFILYVGGSGFYLDFVLNPLATI